MESLWNQSFKKGKGVNIEPSLCLYTPEQVYHALKQNDNIVSWLNFISNIYTPSKQYDILLIYPCSADKPYYKSRSYKALYKTLNSIADRENRIHLITISEPYALIPEEFYYSKTEWYDCPGLFEWFCRKHKLNYNQEIVDYCIDILASAITKFLKRNISNYKTIIACVRTYTSQLASKHDHTHKRMLDIVNKEVDNKIEIIPPAEVISTINKFAWDRYGVSHPIVQSYLYHEIIKRL
ncbi:MAG: DUF5591 domain-containing protein [Candidatus Nitrosocaldaceae archaeon]